MLKLKIILLGSAIGFSAFSFEASLHGDITLKSLSILKQCNLETHLISPNEIITGSVEEDTTQLTTRSRNWHFYNTYGNLRQGPLFFESLDHIFKIRNHELFENNSMQNLKLNNSLGRVLHYIQDMYVPAHVVPVFHGKPFATQDAFDQYILSDVDKTSVLSTINCQEIQKISLQLIESFKNTEHLIFNQNEALLKKSVQFTLENLNSKIENQPVLWKYFWQEPLSKVFNLFDMTSTQIIFGESSKRFGTYVGEFGKNTAIQNKNGDVYSVNQDSFKKFYMNQYKEAVKTSAIYILVNSKK